MKQSLLTPAKLNLGLRVTGVRDNGYHELASLFAPIDLEDRLELDLELSPSPEPVQIDFALAWSDPSLDTGGVPADADNLVARAAARFCELAGLSGRIRVCLEKSIPSGAGLGGGSSDAGATLRLLAAAFPAALEPPTLAELALGLGADVPFFLDPRPAFVTGVGEQIEPLDAFPELWLLLANPRVSLATADVFRAFDSLSQSLTPTEPGSTMRALRGLATGTTALSEILASGLLENDLEEAARRLCPPIGRLMARIREVGADQVAMSGSGATVYGIFSSEQAARVAFGDAKFEPETWARVVRCPEV